MLFPLDGISVFCSLSAFLFLFFVFTFFSPFFLSSHSFFSFLFLVCFYFFLLFFFLDTLEEFQICILTLLFYTTTAVRPCWKVLPCGGCCPVMAVVGTWRQGIVSCMKLEYLEHIGEHERNWKHYTHPHELPLQTDKWVLSQSLRG